MEDNQGLAIRVLSRLKLNPSLDPFGAARSEAILGLIKAAQTFDPSRGVKFSTWATIKVRSHLLDWLRWNVIPHQQRYVPDDTLDVTAETPAHVEQDAISSEFERRIVEGLASETPDVQLVARRLLEGDSQPMIATKLGVTEYRTKQLVDRARHVLRAIYITSI